MAHEIEQQTIATLVVTDIENDTARFRLFGDAGGAALSTSNARETQAVSVWLAEVDVIAVRKHLESVDPTALDRSSSASRQHHIDTGRYLTRVESATDILGAALSSTGEDARPILSYREEASILREAVTLALSILAEG